MRGATLTIPPRSDLGARVREYTCDCDHGTTNALAIDGRFKMTDDDVVQMILARHDLAEGCGCTAELHARYGADSHNHAQMSRGHSVYYPLDGRTR